MVEDAARLRDSLGAPLPPGLPEAHLRPVDDPVGDLVSRYSRTHGPFTANDVAEALGLPASIVSHRLGQGRSSGRVIEGRFLAEAAGTQWCHPDVLRLIKRRSVALLRHQIEPVDRAALASFLPRWHQISGDGHGALRGPEGLFEAVRALAGVPIPVSALESSILPLRVRDYSRGLLDGLTASGEIVWTGCAPLAGGDGWIALAPAEVGFRPPEGIGCPPTDLVALELLELLRSGGGSFVADLRNRMTSPGIVPGHLELALLELLWLDWWATTRSSLCGPCWMAPAAVAVAAPRGSYGVRVDLPGGATRTCGDAHPEKLWPVPTPGAWRRARGPRPPGAPTARAGITPELPGRWLRCPPRCRPGRSSPWRAQRRTWTGWGS